jgi:hypothetical protein
MFVIGRVNIVRISANECKHFFSHRHTCTRIKLPQGYAGWAVERERNLYAKKKNRDITIRIAGSSSLESLSWVMTMILDVPTATANYICKRVAFVFSFLAWLQMNTNNREMFSFTLILFALGGEKNLKKNSSSDISCRAFISHSDFVITANFPISFFICFLSPPLSCALPEFLSLFSLSLSRAN